MTCKERLEVYLREQQAPYAVQHHRTTHSAKDIAATEHIPSEQVAKVVIVIADGRPVMLVMPATFKVDVARLASVVGAHTVRLAHEREFAAIFPDCDLGAMPPFGNLYGLPIYVDQALAANATIVFQAGTHTDTMSMPYVDFARLVKPIVADFVRPPIARYLPEKPVDAE